MEDKRQEQLEKQGLRGLGQIYWNLHTPELYEQIVKRDEGQILHLGPVAVRTGKCTGRSPEDRFLVREPGSEDKIYWGKVNHPFAADKFDHLFNRLQAYLQGRDLFIQDCYGGADPLYRVPLRVCTEMAWQNLFARNLFLQAAPEELPQHAPEYTIIATPNFQALPEVDGTRSGVFVILNFAKKLILIGGTAYAGEIKKSIFTTLNYLLPLRGVLPMHCSANVGSHGDVAVFFGLSGTGKTTLSADRNRRLIGDDEHGWSERGVFNFEGGCYAKVIRLSAKNEPDIYECTRKFGTVLENVTFHPQTRRLDLDDDSVTENTRAGYPLSHIRNSVPEKIGDHPRHIVMLTADAFGVMPPISRLTPAQAMYHFLSGYTAKVGATESGLGKEPKATFSTCFGAPFMVLPPPTYANMLRDKIARHKVRCWLVNTGWTGGPYGTGQRMPLPYTRAMVQAALAGELDDVPSDEDPIFGLGIPRACPGVPQDVLHPRQTWKDSHSYESKARELAVKFRDNFQEYTAACDDEVRRAGPRV